MKKEFIKYEQALALKELGFDEPCFMCYYGISRDDKFDGLYLHNGMGKVCNTHLKEKEKGITAPLYQQAFRWFREKYGLSGLIEIGTQEFSYQVFNNKGNRQLGTEPLKYNGTYEEAESACLDELIEIVKNK